MKITSDDRERILEVFRDNLQGVSLSELSRKSGINRNKATHIAELLYDEGILDFSLHYKSKIFSLQQMSAVYRLLDYISLPSVIISERYQIIRTNSPYLEKYLQNSSDLLGTIPDILEQSQSVPLRETMQTLLLKGKDGEKRTNYDELGREICTCIKTSLINDRPGLLLIIPPDDKTNNTEINTISCPTLLQQLLSITPVIFQKKTLTEAYDELAHVIHTCFPDELILMILISESTRKGTICSVYPPALVSGKYKANIESFMNEKPGITISEQVIQSIKKDRVMYHNNIGELLQGEKSQEQFSNLMSSFGVNSFISVGIMGKNCLIGIIGIGTTAEYHSSHISTEEFISVSDIFSLVGKIFQLSDDNRRITEDYKEHYRQVYVLLTKKTEENAVHSVKAELYRSLLGSVMDNMNIASISTSREGKIFSTNQTLRQFFPGLDNLNPPIQYLSDIFSPEQVKSFMDCMNNENPDMKGDIQSIVMEKEKPTQVTWHSVRYRECNNNDLCIFIGEKFPFHLINYLTTVEPF